MPEFQLLNTGQGDRLSGGNGSHHLHCSSKSWNTTHYLRCLLKLPKGEVKLSLPTTISPAPKDFSTYQAYKSQDSVGYCSLSESLQSPQSPRATHEVNELSLFLAPKRKHSPRFQPAPHHKKMQPRQLWVCTTGTPGDT